jgi:hypothetical protein
MSEYAMVDEDAAEDAVLAKLIRESEQVARTEKEDRDRLEKKIDTLMQKIDALMATLPTEIARAAVGGKLKAGKGEKHTFNLTVTGRDGSDRISDVQITT